MPVEIDLAVEAGDWPDEAAVTALVRRALDATLGDQKVAGDSEMSVVLTDDAAMARLNGTWRGKPKPTNVLSFPSFPDHRGPHLPPMLGDVVLAFETVRSEAAEQEKPFENHLAHLVVHGVLHLLGHDHVTDEEAERMEGAERRILASLAIPDPYG